MTRTSKVLVVVGGYGLAFLISSAAIWIRIKATSGLPVLRPSSPMSSPGAGAHRRTFLAAGVVEAAVFVWAAFMAWPSSR